MPRLGRNSCRRCCGVPTLKATSKPGRRSGPTILERLAVAQGRLEAESGLRRAYDQAVAGRTGIDAFDAWAQELQAEHWLHNHTRMWFASIWIFTLGLPWALGADLFLRHLVDGDPASNTLSWRWVAGLHTRGKAYAARAENIARYTESRFHPRGLNEHPEPLDEPDLGPARPLPRADAAPDGDVALLLHLDDLHPESLPLGRARVARVAALQASVPGADPAIIAFDAASLEDTIARATAHFACPAVPLAPGWNDGLPIVTAWAPVGPTADALPPTLRIRRAWDDAIWPRSTAGYFKVKSAIPAMLARL